jgi:hypothetical protein
MGLANLLSPPSGPNGWQEFWFNNWIDHQTIQQAVNKTQGVNNETYQIDPWSDAAKDELLQKHQLYHNDMNSALGLNGSDLSVLDFKDKEAVKNWVNSHYLEHQSVRLYLTTI